MEAQAKALGIPLVITIDDGVRYSFCDAHAATLVSIEGDEAIYKGQCGKGHTYQTRMKISDLQQGQHIENGELVYGDGHGFKGHDLEEM